MTPPIGLAGGSWEMHDALGHARKPLTPEGIREGAERLGLDVERYDADLADPALRAHVQEDFEGGIASGVNGTPSFFINNVRYDDDYNDEELSEAIEAARRVAAAEGASGVK